MDNKKPSRGNTDKKDRNKFSSRGAARGGRSGGAGRFKTEKSDAVSPNRRRGFAGGERPYDYSSYESEPATPEYMSRLFAGHSFPVDPRRLGLFWRYYELLREHNARLDLTRIMGIEATVLKHFIDSAVILNWFAPSGPVLDIGTGPGFPGLPMAVMRPDVKFILAESRGKRVGFLKETIAALGLKNVRVYPKSVREDSPLGDENGEPVGDVVTRALETISPTLERIRPFMRRDARAVFLKGPGCDGEIAEAEEAFRGVYELAGDVKYDLPATDQRRRLVIFKKLPLPGV